MQQLNLFKNLLPDKHVYKATITQTLRNQIIQSANEKDYKGNFLEVGCDVAYTTESLISYFDKLIAIDIDENRIKKAQYRIGPTAKINFIHGTSKNIPEMNYSTILIDAAHDYENVMNDFNNVLKKNIDYHNLLSGDYVSGFDVYFHDYGLVESGVKRAVEKIANRHSKEIILCGEKDSWNPLGGPIFDYECALIKF